MRRQLFLAMIAGWAVWLILIVSAFVVEASESVLPGAARRFDLSDTIATALIVAAFPVKYGGWLFIWGDGEQPPDWVNGLTFNSLVGLVLWGTLGMTAGAVYGMMKRQREAANA